jgi:hypothetical protein
VQDAKYASIRQAAPPTVYWPQLTPGWAAIQLRTELGPAAVTALLRQELPRVHPTLRVLDVTLQSTLVNDALVRERTLSSAGRAASYSRDARRQAESRPIAPFKF